MSQIFSFNDLFFWALHITSTCFEIDHQDNDFLRISSQKYTITRRIYLGIEQERPFSQLFPSFFPRSVRRCKIPTKFNGQCIQLFLDLVDPMALNIYLTEVQDRLTNPWCSVLVDRNHHINISLTSCWVDSVKSHKKIFLQTNWLTVKNLARSFYIHSQ